MASLEQVVTSNAQITTVHLPRLIAVFEEATTGIGPSTHKKFVRHAVKPRICLMLRSLDSDPRVMDDECRGIHFLTAAFCNRIWMAQNLLPLLETAAKTLLLARVVNVAGGTKEGDVDTASLTMLKILFTVAKSS